MTRWCAAVCLVVITVWLSAGCSAERKAVREIEATFTRGEYRETVALCRHAIRRNLDFAKVYYYYGASLVSMNRDYEGFRQFDLSVARDPSLAKEVAEFLLREAREDFRNSRRHRAAGRFRKAVETDPNKQLGEFEFLVADLYFEEKQFVPAAAFYHSAITANPDTSASRAAYVNLAAAQMHNGSDSAARQTLVELLARFPRGPHRVEARWRLASLAFDEAEKQFVLGNYESVVELLEEMMENTTNHGLMQKARFLLGETYEAMGEFKDAYAAYRGIIQDDRGASGSIVERAREKVRSFREAGLN